MEVNGFSPEELERYARHLSLPDFGLEEQARLRDASILVVGAGGLGCPLLLYLAAAGLGHIGIVDPDVVAESNLHRQVLYNTDQVGQSKAECAKERLRRLNPNIRIEAFPEMLTPDNALDLIRPFDLVADGSDNFSTRYLVNDACVILDKTNVFASIFRYEGQVAVFNHLRPDGSRGPNYRDIFPSPPPAGQIPNCAEAGVVGVLPGIIGSLQANEVIKLLTGIGEVLDGRLFTFDAASLQQQTLKIKAQAQNRPEKLKLEDYIIWCAPDETDIPELEVRTLKEMFDSGKPLTLVDVRESRERLSGHLGGLHFPIGKITEHANEIPKDHPVIIYCHSGLRSATAVQQLQEQFGFQNLLNLKGGIVAWNRAFGPAYRQKS